MLSNTVFKSTMEGIKAIAGTELYLYDPEGAFICGTKEPYDDCTFFAKDFAESDDDIQSFAGAVFAKIKDKGRLLFIMATDRDGEGAVTTLRLAAYQLQNMVAMDTDRSDKDNFFKNVILDNLLQIDIYERSRKFHIEDETPRLVYIINVEDDSDNKLADILRPIYGENAGGYIFKVDEQHIVYVKDLADSERDHGFAHTAEQILGVINEEGQEACISYGNVAEDLKALSRSYKEAGLAMEVGSIFYKDLKIMAYSKLGIGRLIYQLPLSLCHMFLQEVFGNKDPEELDDETLQTVDQFFKDSLNISEASRNLFIHRNTLVYRLDKLERTLGLNIRNFDDAMTLKLALMVETYMGHIERTQ